MRFGVCAPLEKMDRLAEVGYDYIELGVQSALIPEKDEAEFQQIQAQALSHSIKAEAYAGFLPGDLRVVGDEIDQQRLSSYVETTCRRAQSLDSKIIVYGSSGSRNVAEGCDFDRALGQIADFLSMAADHAETHGIVIVIEPLCARECNIIQTVADGLAMAKRVNRPGIQVLADLYHVWQESEPMSNIVDAAEWLAHVHIAEPVKRSYPGNDSFDFFDFFSALKAAGYQGRVSCECSFDDFDCDVETALHTMKSYLE
ncbi:TPA: sugar phosphate isomerase/epimerase [Candidatus Poribacteria bacterium]|nr:sugar phosphate isomerase/epimerase [Candidatus Poribacteria bacterium]HIC01772.1 sugar phosphate isomerase/epimerase [Candidatus Poribacteria bacterium]